MKAKTENQKLAAKYRVDRRTIRSWRTAGAPLDKPKRMTAWLALRRRMPSAAAISKPSAAPSAPVDTNPQQPGAAAALSRMEFAELEAHQRCAVAMASGDLLEIRATFMHWEKCVESVRKLSKQITTDMREQGELVHRSEVLHGLRLLGQFMLIAANGQAPQIAFEIVGLEQQVDRYVLLKKCILSQAVVSYSGIEAMGCPRWMLDALQDHIVSGYTVTAGELSAYAKVIHEAAEAAGASVIGNHLSECAIENARFSKSATTTTTPTTSDETNSTTI